MVQGITVVRVANNALEVIELAFELQFICFIYFFLNF